MPVKYFIKRNSLSSKWGVWTTGDGPASTVESLVAELKSSEDAEAYCERIQAGESHDAIIDSLKSGKSKKDGGGLFGRFRKKDGDSEAHVAEIHNPVIEIEKEELPTSEESASDEPKATPVAKEAPSRFQVIEPAPRPAAVKPTPAPVAEVAKVAEESSREAEPTIEEVKAAQAASFAADDDQGASRVKEITNPSSISARVRAAFGRSNDPEVAEPPKVTAEQETDPTETEAPVALEEEAPVSVVETETPVAQEEKTPAAVAPTAATEAAKPAVNDVAESDDSSAEAKLVDWTFTPPPDVTPSEVQAEKSPQTNSESIEPRPIEPVKTAVAPVRPSAPKIQEISAPSAPAKTARVASEDATQTRKPVSSIEDSRPASRPGDSGLTVEIGISKALKDVTAGDPRVSDKKYNSVASKEFTEVNKAFTLGSSPEHLREELLHLAAVCLAWADAIEKRGLKTVNSKAA